MLERAEALQVPVYLHPTPPPQPVIDVSYVGNYTAEVTERLATAAWGWHIETAIHALRLILREHSTDIHACSLSLATWVKGFHSCYSG